MASKASAEVDLVSGGGVMVWVGIAAFALGVGAVALLVGSIAAGVGLWLLAGSHSYCRRVEEWVDTGRWW